MGASGDSGCIRLGSVIAGSSHKYPGMSLLTRLVVTFSSPSSAGLTYSLNRKQEQVILYRPQATSHLYYLLRSQSGHLQDARPSAYPSPPGEPRIRPQNNDQELVRNDHLPRVRREGRHADRKWSGGTRRMVPLSRRLDGAGCPGGL